MIAFIDEPIDKRVRISYNGKNRAAPNRPEPPKVRHVGRRLQS